MEFNLVGTGLELVGTAIKELNVANNIADIENEGKRSLGLNINEPTFQKTDDVIYAELVISFEIELEQEDGHKCNIKLSLEGAFLSDENADEEEFKELVIINGAAALISIARGKIEAISANIFNNGKIVIPFINVVEYYKSLEE